MPKWWDNVKRRYKGWKSQQEPAPVVEPEPEPIATPIVEEPVPIVFSNYAPSAPAVVAPPPETADYYVATAAGGGSDSNPGTEALPFLTVGKAATTMTAGQLTYVRAGIYAESVTAITSGGGTWATATRIKSYPGETATIKPTGSSSAFHFDSITANWLIFEDLILDGINMTANNSVVKIRGANVHHIRLQDCEVRNGQGLGNGVLVNDPSHDCEFIGGSYHDNGKVSDPSAAYGLYLEGDDNLVNGVEVYNNGGYGIHSYMSGGTANNNIIRNCRIHNNTATATQGRSGITSQNGTGTLIYNNLIYDEPGEAGIYIAGGAVQVKVYNNTVYSNTGSGIKLRSGCDQTVLQNNISYSNGNNIDRSTDTNTTLTTNLTTDPTFVDGTTPPYDFNLQASSAARNAGTDASAILTDDYAGTTRPKGAGWDIGAYEYIE